MAIPPPPGPPMPPGPPPPPIGGLKLGAPAGGDPRSALLQSIQKGTKLKKTTTVDKSGPALAGKVRDGSNVSPKRNNNNQTASNINSNNSNNAMGNGTPKLGGLFEGLTAMPKLKPVNGSRTAPSQRSHEANTTNKREESTATLIPQSNNNAMDFNAELTKHLTLKRQKQQVNVTEANLKTNRGPPPQPPTSKNLVMSTSDSVLEKPKISSVNGRSNPVVAENAKASSPTLSEGRSSSPTGGVGNVKNKASTINLSLGNNSVNNKNNQYTTVSSQHSTKTRTTTISKLKHSSYGKTETSSTMNKSSTSSITSSEVAMHNVVPNKSTLFGTNSATPNDNNYDDTSVSVRSSDSNKSQSPSNKPVPNHGKPNFAPKPPGLQRLNLASNGQRPVVARHHSMKSPRSPPNTIGGALVFPNQQLFGTMRTPSQLCQSQDGINSNLRTAPNPPIGRPTVAPPKPPSVKPPPPPTPVRSVSNSNLNSLTQNTSSSNSSSSANTFSSVQTASVAQSSASNVASMNGGTNTFSNTNAPTPPPPPLTIVGSGSPVQKSHNTREKPPMPIILNGGSIIAPPLPPHRTCPAPPPPQRQSSTTGTGAPPVPPQRHSSIRANAPTTPPASYAPVNFGSGNLSNTNTVSRLVIDLELKFGKRFHNVTEFPKPPPFLNIQKVFPSRTMKTTNGM